MMHEKTETAGQAPRLTWQDRPNQAPLVAFGGVTLAILSAAWVMGRGWQARVLYGDGVLSSLSGDVLPECGYHGVTIGRVRAAAEAWAWDNRVDVLASVAGYDAPDVDAKVSEWHASASKLPLHEYLGMTRDEYAAFVEGRPSPRPQPDDGTSAPSPTSARSRASGGAAGA